jgi:hypothetical protein
MRFRAAAVVPPIVLSCAKSRTLMPLSKLAMAAVPAAFVPMRFPWMVLPEVVAPPRVIP